MKCIAAFCNSQGGILKIGVADDGAVIGIDNSKQLLEQLPNLINQKIGVLPIIELNTDNGREILVLTVKPSAAPVSFQGRYYIRSGSMTTELRGAQLTDFLIKKSGITWDALDVPDNLDFESNSEAINYFKDKSFYRLPFASVEKDNSRLLKKLNLIQKNGHPNRAAFLLFDKNPQRYFPHAVVKIGRFSSDSDIISGEIVGGNLFEQAGNAITVLKNKYLLNNIMYDGIYRKDVLDYPEDALREAVVNAIVHRDYQTTSAVLIKVYADSLTISNEGGLPSQLSIDDLKREHLSIPRNPLIADLFYKAGLIEAWGRGTLKILNECIHNKLPEPFFFGPK